MTPTSSDIIRDMCGSIKSTIPMIIAEIIGFTSMSLTSTENIFFAINSAKIQDDQQAKIASLVEYLEKNATAKVSVTGYADKGTGNARINSKLSEKRANNVVEALKAKGIAADRITVAYKGDTVQPYKTPEENRVSICIAE